MEYKELHMDRLFDQMESWKLSKVDIDYFDLLNDLDGRLDSKDNDMDISCSMWWNIPALIVCSVLTDQYNDLVDEYNALIDERNAKRDSACALVNQGRAKQYHELHKQWAGDSSDFTALLKEESLSIDDLKQIKEHYRETAEEKHQVYLAAVQKYMDDTDPDQILLHMVEDLPLIGLEVKHIADYVQDPSEKNLRRMILGLAGPVGEIC